MSRKYPSRKHLISASAVSAIAMGCLPNIAVAEGEQLAEVVVTAQKREQSVMDVGATLSVLSAESLERQRITKGEDLAIAVPSLTFARSDYNTPIFSLRGIGFNSSSLGAYPAVSIYVDEAPLVFSALAANATFDLQRIEVLKGPQGTLFGQNSTGGAINFITNKPTEELSAGISGTYGRFNLFEVTGHISGPITDTLRARLAVQAHTMDPWQISATRPDDRNGREEYFTGRLMLEWEPSDNFKSLLTVSAWKDDTQPLALALAGTKYAYPQYLTTPTGAPVLNQPIVPTRPRYADWGGPQGPSTDPFVAAANPTRLFAHRDQLQGTLRMEYRPTDTILLTSLTSYVDFDQDASVSRSGSAAQNEDQSIMLGAVKSFTQEFRAESTNVDNYHWIVGVNYEHSTVSEFQLQSYVNNTSAINSNIFQNTIDLDSRIDNWAVFANVDYKVLERVNLKAGARYTKSKYNYQNCDTDYGDGNIANIFNFLGNLFNDADGVPPFISTVPFEPIGTGPGECFTMNYNLVPGEVFNDTLREDNVSWMGGIDFHAAESLLLYANVSKGYKQGSYPTASPASWIGLQPVTQESVLAYELGVKSEFLERRLAVNAAGFIYKYKDKQVRGTILDSVWGALPQLRNIPESKINGVEVEVNAVPVDGLRLSAAAVYLDTKITRISPLEFDVAGVQRDMTGAPIPLTPKWSYRLDGEYSWDMGKIKPFIGVTYRWEGGKDANISAKDAAPAPIDPSFPQNRFVPGYEFPFVIDSYGLLSARAGFGAIDGRWSIYAWCDNCTNKYYWSNVTIAQDNISRGVGRTATYGLTTTYKF
jgi:iron complex outermembrane recepter protein